MNRQGRQRQIHNAEPDGRAISQRPAILLADEPTGNLDSETGTEVMWLLKLTQKQLGQTIVLITHPINLLKSGVDKP